MIQKLSVMMAAGALLVAPLAFANKACEADCDETAKVCEDAMLKKLGKDNKAALGQVKKICAEAGKQCKDDCKK